VTGWRVALAVACALVGVVACGGDGDAEHRPQPAVAAIGDAIAALEEALGGPQRYFEINADPLLEVREQVNRVFEAEGVKLSVNDFLVRAAALALGAHPEVNSRWAGDTIEQMGEVNIGVAVALPAEKGGGLVVPTLRDVPGMSLPRISSETRRLAKKAREQGLTLEEMSDATFTISNLGMFGVEHFEAIINPPQAAILAVGAAIEKPVVRNGKLTIGHEMTLTLSADHRVVDGAIGAQYLDTLKQLLEAPAAMLV